MLLEQQVQQVQPELLDRWAQQALPVQQARRDPLAQRVLRVLQEPPAALGLLDLREKSGQRVPPAALGLQAHKATKAPLVQPARLAQLVLRVL